MSHTSRIIGAAFEEQLALLHKIYAAHHLALVRHNGTQATMKRGEWIPQASAPDYTGILTCVGSRYVSFDAKHRQTTRYYHAKNKMHQTQHLWEDHQAGGIAFLLVLVEPPGKEPTGWMLWPQDYWQEHYPAWSLNLTGEVDPALAMRVPAWARVSHGYIPDWLKVVFPPLAWEDYT